MGTDDLAETRSAFTMTSWALGLCGAAVGAALGAMIFGWALRQGFYAIALPGALLGIGGSLAFKGRSNSFGIVCALLALATGIVLEWRFRPFAADGSFGYFLGNLHKLTSVTHLMILLGAVFGYWFGRGR